MTALSGRRTVKIGSPSHYVAKMTDLIETKLHKAGNQLPGRLSMPGDDRYLAATAIWAKPSGTMPRAVVTVVQCKTSNQPFVPRAIASFHYQCVAAATTGLVARCATESLST